jgi:hypothetical protein
MASTTCAVQSTAVATCSPCASRAARSVTTPGRSSSGIATPQVAACASAPNTAGGRNHVHSGTTARRRSVTSASAPTAASMQTPSASSVG